MLRRRLSFLNASDKENYSRVEIQQVMLNLCLTVYIYINMIQCKQNFVCVWMRPPVLAYADYLQLFKLHTDASCTGLGTVLYQTKMAWILSWHTPAVAWSHQKDIIVPQVGISHPTWALTCNSMTTYMACTQTESPFREHAGGSTIGQIVKRPTWTVCQDSKWEQVHPGSDWSFKKKWVEIVVIPD